eukprot:gnl/TRDRNA2_/TRDRNA2_44482_c0_seq1.p1 gnl/TRDRNA2_/TRDRNA2_44482_c0~~gnl/TRDRNA2_/TRDRNA2_44482_c0_seq1.p1  ORF type:complete len:221 (+),score=58.71 gnl/TRDRNA2_/TRDRNA2_44482_c0_seq1:58-663(+)
MGGMGDMFGGMGDLFGGGGGMGGMGGMSSEQATPEERYDLLPEGALVLIRGIQSRTELNDKLGYVQDFQEARQRYVVKLKETSETMSLSVQKLHHVVLNARIKGLKERPDLDGIEGIVYEFSEESSSFKVQVTSKKEQLSLAPDNLELPDGTSVQIVGVQKLPDLNGRRGRILSFNEATGRYSVQISAGEVKHLRPANVHP